MPLYLAMGGKEPNIPATFPHARKKRLRGNRGFGGNVAGMSREGEKDEYNNIKLEFSYMYLIEYMPTSPTHPHAQQ